MRERRNYDQELAEHARAWNNRFGEPASGEVYTNNTATSPVHPVHTLQQDVDFTRAVENRDWKKANLILGGDVFTF